MAPGVQRTSRERMQSCQPDRWGRVTGSFCGHHSSHWSLAQLGDILSSSGVCNAPEPAAQLLFLLWCAEGAGAWPWGQGMDKPGGPSGTGWGDSTHPAPAPFLGSLPSRSIVGPLAAARSFTGRHGPHGYSLPARTPVLSGVDGAWQSLL